MAPKRKLAALALLSLSSACTTANKNGAGATSTYDATVNGSPVGGRPSVVLSSPPGAGASEEGAAGLRFTEATVLPGRGMNILRLRAQVPGKGIVDLLETPGDPAAYFANRAQDLNGNLSFETGGAILLPYANRVRGQVTKDGRDVRVRVLGHKLELPANWAGHNPVAERHAMHGLMLDAKMDSVTADSNTDHAVVTAHWKAGNFDDRWLSQTDVTVHAELKAESFSFTVTATNIGKEKLPMAIGWHPYFTIPSGKRAQARVFVPATERVQTNNYDDVFPTGKILPIHDTAWDVGQKGGLPLGDAYLDDCFTALDKAADGTSYAELVDPAAHYGLRVKALAPWIGAYQVYAPKDRAVVAIEPQFNLPDPFDTAVWGKKRTPEDNGVAVLAPGESVVYSIALELFTP